MNRISNTYTVRFLYNNELRNYCIVEAPNEAFALTEAMVKLNYPDWTSISEGFQVTIDLFDSSKKLPPAPLMASSVEVKHAEMTVQALIDSEEGFHQRWVDSIPTDEPATPINDHVVFELTKQKLIEFIHHLEFSHIYHEE